MSLNSELTIHTMLEKVEKLLEGGQLSEAEQLLIELHKNHPRNEAIGLMLSSIYGRRAEFQKVVDCCKNILSTNPVQPIAHSLLGAALISLGNNLDEAIKHLEVAENLTPGNPSILNNLANALYAKGRIEEAKNKYHAVLQLNPRHAQANFGLGNCSLAQARWLDAVLSFRKAYHAMADNYDINMSLGKAYLNLGGFDAAIECFQRAMKLTDQPAVVFLELASAKQLQGHLDQALDYVNKSLQHQPGNINARAERAEIMYKMGNIYQAHDDIHDIVSREKLTSRVALVYGNICQHFDECSSAITLAESLLSSSNIRRTDAVGLHFMLGKLYDKGGEYDLAFQHYYKANNSVPETYNRDEHSRGITRLISNYSNNVIKRLQRASNRDERPVFIVGMPRSGTSLLEQIISSHPQVSGAGELPYINELANDLFQKNPPNSMADLLTIDQCKLDELAHSYFSSIGGVAGNAMRVTDKMPGNYIWLGLIMQLFPRSRIIHCRRDPRDTCLSIYFQSFNKGHSYAHDLSDIAFYYRQYERMMDHWEKVLDLPVLEVNYAELVSDLECHAHDLIEFLDLEWDNACLEFHKSERATATASWDQVRQPVYTKSINRWKHYRSHLSALLDEFGEDDIVLDRKK